LEALARRRRALEIVAERRSVDLTLGDPPHHRSALAQFASRPEPPVPTISIPPRAEWIARRDKAVDAGSDGECVEAIDPEVKRRREYERTRKHRWRTQRKRGCPGS
jgi:hypothetical protein